MPLTMVGETPWYGDSSGSIPGNGSMTKEKVQEVITEYRRTLLSRGNSPARRSEVPNEGHLMWMCNQVDEFIEEGRLEKAMRWLGFIQGALWWAGIRSVEEMKADNKPPEEELDPDRV